MIRFLAFLLLLIAAPVAHAQDFPKLTGRVVDQAGVLKGHEAALDAKLAALEQRTGRQLVVATIKDMQDYPLEDYGYRLGRAWGIGQKAQNDGVLLFIAPNNPAGERGPRIEVGYGLEPYLTDALSSIIINREMMPRLRNGDIPGAIDAGVDAIAQQLALPPEQAAARQKQMLAQNRQRSDGGIPITLIFWIVVIVIFVLPTLFGGRRGRRYRSGVGPVILWDPGSGGGSWGGGGSSWGGGGGGFSGGGGSFGGGGASGNW